MAHTLGLCRTHLPQNLGLWRAHRMCCRSVVTAVAPQPISAKKRQVVDQIWPNLLPPPDLTHTVSSLGFSLAGVTGSNYKLSSTDIASAVKYLTHKQYEHLRSTIPYMEGVDRERAHWYLVWTDKLPVAMEPLLNHSAMGVLVELVEENVLNYTPYEAAEILRSLVYIGYDTTSPVFHKLFLHAKAHIEHMGVRALVLMASTSSAVVDYEMMRRIINRCHELFLTESIPLNDANMSAFSALVKILRFYLSYAAQERIYSYMLHATQNLPFEFQSTDTFVTLIGATCILTQYGQSPPQKQIIDAGKQHLPDRIDKCQPIHLEKLASILRLIHQYDDATRIAVDSQVQNLVNRGNLNFSDVFELFCSLSRRSDGPLIKTLEAVVEQIVKKWDVDKVIVWKLGMALHNVDSTNVKLVTFVQSKVADCIIGEPWIPFLTQKEFVSRNHKNALIDTLFTNVSVQGGPSNKLACIYILAFMLPLHSERYSKLVQLIESWNSEELSRFLQGLMEWQKQEKRIKHRQPMTKSHRQVRTVISAVCDRIVAKLDVSNPQALYTTIQCLSSISVKKSSPDNYLQILMDRFWTNAKQTIGSTSPFALRYILSFCNASRYFTPDLCDALGESVLGADELRYALFIRLFDYIGFSGYAPRNMDALMPAALWLLDELDKTDSMLQYLRTVVNLVLVNRVPEDVLRSVFTGEFLQRLHVYLQHNPDRRRGTYQYLVFLNQCAVIDYPQLQIPWFLDEVGQKLAPKVEAIHYHTSVLDHIAGGADFYKTLTLSPCCHQMAFELITSKKDNSILAWNSAHGRTDVERVAVMVENVNSFCLVPKGSVPRMAAKRKREMNHVRKLGYRVVEVPYFEWKWKTREEYTEFMQRKLKLVQQEAGKRQ